MKWSYLGPRKKLWSVKTSRTWLRSACPCPGLVRGHNEAGDFCTIVETREMLQGVTILWARGHGLPAFFLVTNLVQFPPSLVSSRIKMSPPMKVHSFIAEMYLFWTESNLSFVIQVTMEAFPASINSLKILLSSLIRKELQSGQKLTRWPASKKPRLSASGLVFFLDQNPIKNQWPFCSACVPPAFSLPPCNRSSLTELLHAFVCWISRKCHEAASFMSVVSWNSRVPIFWLNLYFLA